MRIYIVTAVFITLLFSSSCSRCWNCSHEVEVIVGSDTTLETVTEETCLKDDRLYKEANGYTCQESGFNS